MDVFLVEDPGGAVVSRLSVDGAEFWLSTVADPEAVFGKAIAAGARGDHRG